MTQLLIKNDGPRIASTNYWRTPHSKRFLYLTINAGALRVLLPPSLAEEILEAIKTSHLLILSRGPWPAGQRADALELLLEDGSETPFALHLDIRQIDRLPLDHETSFPCTFWTEGIGGVPRLAAQLPTRYRRVDRIPCLRAWP